MNLKRVTAVALGVMLGVAANLNPTITQASPRVAQTQAGVYDCQPGGASIRPWNHISTSGVVRGAGTTCGPVALTNEWSAYAWDEAADGGCIFLVADHTFNGVAGPYTQIPNTYVCGNGNVSWQIWGINSAEYVRVVVDFSGTTYSKQIYP